MNLTHLHAPLRVVVARKIHIQRPSGGFGAKAGKLDGAFCAKKATEKGVQASGPGAPQRGSGAAFRAEQRSRKSRSRRADAVRIRRAAPCACHRNPRRTGTRSPVADTHQARLSVRGSLLAHTGAQEPRAQAAIVGIYGCVFGHRPLYSM